LDVGGGGKVTCMHYRKAHDSWHAFFFL
jgi:hypothetical protein